MAFPNDQLFLDRFVAYNKRRYKDDPVFVDKLNALTLQTIQFSNFRKVELENGVTAHLVDVNSENILHGVNQKYIPADFVKHGPAELEEKDPLSKDDLERKGVQGIYFLGVGADDNVGAVLVYNGSKNLENIKALVMEKCYFELTDEDIKVSEDLTLVTIDSKTIVGVLQVVESLYDDSPRYNGQYSYNGTLSY